MILSRPTLPSIPEIVAVPCSIWTARWWVLIRLSSPAAPYQLAVVVDDTAQGITHVVRGSDLEEGESQGLPVWSQHVGDPILESNLTRRIDFALFMVAAIENDDLIHQAPAIVGCQSPSALAAQGS